MILKKTNSRLGDARGWKEEWGLIASFIYEHLFGSDKNSMEVDKAVTVPHNVSNASQLFTLRWPINWVVFTLKNNKWLPLNNSYPDRGTPKCLTAIYSSSTQIG